MDICTATTGGRYVAGPQRRAVRAGIPDRFFYLLVPFIRDAQEIHIRPALGSLYDEIVGAEDREVRFAEVLYLVRRAVPLFAVMTAVRRLSVRVLTVGIVKQCYE